MVIIWTKTLNDNDIFLKQLELSEQNNRDRLIKDLEFFLSKNWILKDVVQSIYDLDSKIYLNSNEKKIRLVLLDFLSIIFLYKKEIEKNDVLLNENLVLKEQIEESKKEFFEFVKKVKLETDHIVADIWLLKEENNRLLLEKNQLTFELEQKDKALEIAFELVYDLNKELLELRKRYQDLEIKIYRLKTNINQIVDLKIKRKNQEYLKELEQEIKNRLQRDLELKKELLETRIEKINSTYNISLSIKEFENSELREILKKYKKKLSLLEERLLDKTTKNIDLILEKSKSYLSIEEGNNYQLLSDKDKEIKELKAKLALEQKKNKELLTKNSELKKENSALIKKNEDLQSTIIKIS